MGFSISAPFVETIVGFASTDKPTTPFHDTEKMNPRFWSPQERWPTPGVHLIDLTMGEDPALFADGDKGFQRLAHICRQVRQETGLPVMISPGVMPEHALKMLAEAGVTWYACYQETHNRTLYSRLRAGQDFEERMDAKRTARKLGMLIEEGLLTGVGESLDDLATSMEMMAALDAHQVRVMTFVPQAGTPMVDVFPSEN